MVTMPSKSLAAIAATGLGLLASICANADELPRRPVFGASVIADPAGVRVQYIAPGSPADRAGLKTGDIVKSIATHPIASTADLIAIVRATPVEQPEPLQIVRAGALQTLTVTLVTAPKESDPNVDTIYSAITVDGTLRRTLTILRANQQKLPALLIVGGIGCFSVDNPNDPYDAYRYLAHDLTRAGIVVMRIEKSGMGDSQGKPCFDTDFNAEAASYKIALDALRSDAHVDPRRIFLFGHSIGSVIIPRLAQESPVAGIIFAEGVGRNWFEYELWNLRRQAELAGESPTEIDAALRSKEVCMHRLLIEQQSESDIEHDLPECRTRNKYPVADAYMQEVAALDIAEPWTPIAVPVLGIYGTGDFVTAEADHRRIIAIVNANHPGTATLHTIDGMDHHLGAAGSPQVAYDLRVKNHKEAPYEERLSSEVSGWICAQTHCG
jgi:pimeloyl-ACP methyl ester carboxylesterase